VTYGYGNDDPDGNSSGYSNRSLAVVVGRKESGVLEGPIYADEGQLRASKNGIDIEVGHIEAVHDRRGLAVAVEWWSGRICLFVGNTRTSANGWDQQ
jgi:hypothetical protein